MGQINTVPSKSQEINNFSNHPADVGQNLLPSTFTTHGEKKANFWNDSEGSDSNDPDMSDVFIDSKTGKRDYKSYFVHWRAKYKTRDKAAASTKATHKIIYRRVHPPTLHLDP